MNPCRALAEPAPLVTPVTEAPAPPDLDLARRYLLLSARGASRRLTAIILPGPRHARTVCHARHEIRTQQRPRAGATALLSGGRRIRRETDVIMGRS